MSPLPSNPNRISARNIKDEFGQKGSTWNIKDYRRSIQRGGVEWPVDDGIPTSGTIRFSDFHSKQHNIIILMSGGTGYRQTILGDKSSIDSTAYRGTSSGVRRTSKNIVYIIKTIGSARSDDHRNTCALRTENKNRWYGGNPRSGKVIIRLGNGGKLYGAGGEGGKGGDYEQEGGRGGNGTSALGLEVNVESITVDSGAVIVAGSGGGGGGGGSREDSATRNRRAGGGGGGGGAGLPGGEGGKGRRGTRRGEANGRDGSAGSTNNGGNGGMGSDNDEEATGGGGGGGGALNGNVGEGGPKRPESGGRAGEDGKTNGKGGGGGSGKCTGGRCKGETESDGGGDPGFAITRGSGISQPSLNGTSRIKGNSNTQSGVR